jgi:hypothetical protein
MAERTLMHNKKVAISTADKVIATLRFTQDKLHDDAMKV